MPQQIEANCSQGRLVITDKTISVKPLNEPKQPAHWSVRITSIQGVQVVGYGSICEVTFLARDGRELTANSVAAADGHRIAQAFGRTAQILGTWEHPTTPTLSSSPAWQNAPTIPVQPAPTGAGTFNWRKWMPASDRPILTIVWSIAGAVLLAALLVMSFNVGYAGARNWVSASGRPSGYATEQPAEPTATTIPTPTDTPVPTDTPYPTDTPIPQPKLICTDAGCSPWGYSFEPGNLIYNPPDDFCSYFTCIKSFWNGGGYVEQCQDNMYSLSGGNSGSCSYHGGGKRPLYSH